MSDFQDEMLWSLKSDYVRKIAEQGLRVDERDMWEYRDIEIVPNYIERPAGSAMVKLGGTTIIAGVTVNVGQPFGDTPDDGVLMTNAELVPMASPNFEAGPPDPASIEFARVVDRGIREGQAIDTSKLVIESGEKVWMVFVDFHVLDYDGNLFDAGALAAMTALNVAKLPKYEDEKIIREEVSMDMPVKRQVVETTFAKIGNTLMVDPILDEEKAADARLTIATTDDGYVCASQKGGSGALTVSEIEQLVDLAFEKGDYLRDVMNKAIKGE
jgi:exosome complex component RRP42